MTHQKNPSYQLQAQTPRFRSFRSRLALSPVSSLIAECENGDAQFLIRITDYGADHKLASIPVGNPPIEMSFSPAADYLIAIPNGRRKFLVASAPWSKSNLSEYGVPHEDTSEKTGAFHVVWLNEHNALLAGLSDSLGRLWIGLFDCRKCKFDLLYEEDFSVRDFQGKELLFQFLDCAFCSPSGIVAFGLGVGSPYVGTIGIYSLDKDHRKVESKRFFRVDDSNGIALDVAVMTDSKHIMYCNDKTVLRGIDEDNTIHDKTRIGGHPREKRLVYSAGHVLIRRGGQYGSVTVYADKGSELFRRASVEAEPGQIGAPLSSFDATYFRDMDCAIHEGRTHIGVGYDDHAKIFELLT